MPPYAQLHQRLQWITTLDQGAIAGAFSKAELLAVLRVHSIFCKASLGKMDCALELLPCIAPLQLAGPAAVARWPPPPVSRALMLTRMRRTV